MQLRDSIFVAGHRGLVGSAVLRRLQAAGYKNLILRDRRELDLTQQSAVNEFFAANRPAYVVLAAAKVGGILENIRVPAEFLRDNVLIQTNVIDAAHKYETRKLLFLGSSCIYPQRAPQPMSEQCLLTGPLEPTNEAYAVAKIIGLKMCQVYRLQYGLNAICIIPPNLYGPFDNFSSNSSHVVSALMRKMWEAMEGRTQEVEIWGTGKPRRELLHVDDLADACLQFMLSYEGDDFVNVGWGHDVSIAELAQTIARIVGFQGTLYFNDSKPDGMPQKLMDVKRMKSFGWMPNIDLEAGLRSTYAWFLDNSSKVRS